MARRNLFQPPPLPNEPAAGADADGRARFPNTGAMSGVKSTLRDLSSNAIREIDPALIEEDGPRDRLTFTDADVADLAESIRRHGQQVPLMVRPKPGHPGYFRIVYGRRRLRALKLLGMPARVLVRSLDDTQAILAQGQENSQRLDPSFIEKALFASELSHTGTSTEVIIDALAIDKPMLSRMQKVTREIPEALIRKIGPAHGIGRRRWEEFADFLRDQAVEPDRVLAALPEDWEQLTSDERFARIAALMMKKPASLSAAGSGQVITARDGRRLAEMKATSRVLSIRLSSSDTPGFTDWMRQAAPQALQELYETWKKSNPTL